MLTFLIMAGGSGERFWPLSTKEKPKQLLKIFAEKSLLKLTYERALKITSASHIFIATNAVQLAALRAEMPEVPLENIIIEPDFRDTASAIAYGCVIISKYFVNPTICVLASDHLITKEESFKNVIEQAAKLALEDKIVTIGLKPTRAETGYGYIEVSNPTLNVATKALAFKEKPDYITACRYLESGNYYWNSGMLVFTYKTIMEAFKNHSLKHYEVAEKIAFKIDKNDLNNTALLIKEDYEIFPKISIDFAVMEKALNIVVIPADLGWSDVGSYNAFQELFNGDKDGNIFKNIRFISVDSNDNIIIGDNVERRVSLLGVKNMVVVVADDEVLVCSKDQTQELKKVLKLL